MCLTKGIILKDEDKTKAQLIEELQSLHQRVAELEQSSTVMPRNDVADEDVPQNDQLLHDIARLAKVGAWKLVLATGAAHMDR